MQEVILDGIEEILAFNDISLNIYFKTLQPLEFANDIVASPDTKEEATGLKLASNEPSDAELGDAFKKLSSFGEEIDEEKWELVEESPVDYDAEKQMDKFFAFASTGAARTNASSAQDGITPDGRPYKVRYGYAPQSASPDSREFCRLMVNANKVYRKEDILAMSSQPVNSGFGPRGAATYDIWLYKGGARCHHFWMRKVFMAKEGAVGVDANSPNAEVGVNQAKRAGAELEVNDKNVALRPVDMPNEGFLNPR